MWQTTLSKQLWNLKPAIGDSYPVVMNYPEAWMMTLLALYVRTQSPPSIVYGFFSEHLHTLSIDKG